MSNYINEEIHPSVLEKYSRYEKFFHCKLQRKNLLSSDYDIVLLKSLIAFFMYQEKKNDKHLTLNNIAKILGYKSHTGVLYAIKNIKNVLLLQPKLQVNNKEISKYFLILNGISIKNGIGYNKNHLKL